MKRTLAWNRAALAASALCLVAAPNLRAQAAPTGPVEEEQPIVLSPFIVDAAEDQGSYQANSTLAGSRVRTDLKDVASAISVVTKEFLRDTGAKNGQDLLVYTPSTEVGGIRGNFSGVAAGAVYQENTVTGHTRVRGLDSADNTRDYFLTDIPWDGFNVGRVDLQRGPNSILFGVGSPAGIINSSVNDATMKSAYQVENRIDEWGSLRNSIDLNQAVIPHLLALRVAAVVDNEKYEQKPAFNNATRYFAALRFDPKLFGESAHTSIRAKYEDGRVRSNNPRSTPPINEITYWFKSGVDQYGNLGYNKLTINQFSLTNPNPSGVPLPGGTGGFLAARTYELGGWAQGREYWAQPNNYYEMTPLARRERNSLAPPVQPSATPMFTIAGQPNTGSGLADGNGNRISGITGYRPVGIPPMSQYGAGIGQTQGTTGTGTGTYPWAPLPGGIFYADEVLTDASIFDFYSKLLDGPNKKEWQNWKALNVAIDQSFLHDRLAFQLALDHQDYDSGAYQWMTGSNYAITVDVNETYANGAPNPNVGRPMVANSGSAPSLNFKNRTVRNTARLTVTGELRAEDLLGKTRLAGMLGKHVFTGLWESNTVVRSNVGFAQYATTPDYALYNNAFVANPINGLGSGRQFEWIAYVGPSLRDASSAAGANLTNLEYVIRPPKYQSLINFDSHWNRPTDPTDPNYVDPTALTYNFTAKNGTVNTNQAQSNNPANYVGWTTENIEWMFADNPDDFQGLVQSASRTRYRDVSRGITWQANMFDGVLVPTFGWRKDVVTNYQTNAVSDASTGFTSTEFPDNLGSRTDVRGESKSWGAVVHLPKFLADKLPLGTTISAFYDRSRNFRADATRLSLEGLPIPNAQGDTKEYGVTITTLNDRLTLKINKFRTKVANATLAETSGNSIGGLGNNAYFIADGSIWGYGWATQIQDFLRGQTPGSNYGDYANNDGFTRNTPAEIAAYDAYNRVGGTSPSGINYVGGNAIVDAWVHAPFPATFFSSYALTPAVDPTIGARTGNLRDSYTQGINNANGPVLGGGSTFGNHQTTVDNLSSGTEIELMAQPLKNWNVSVNYSKVDATHESIDAVSRRFIGSMTRFMNGPGGQIREWFNGGQTLQAQWNSSIVAPYTVFLNALGHAAPEVSPWRLNAVTTYNFDRGLLKGAFIGGALRVEAGRIIGYRFDPNFANANTNDPDYANVRFLTQGGLNVNQPFKGDNDQHFDLWLGYSRKVARDVNWRIQLNIRSVGEKNKLVAARLQPNGDLALARIQQGMGWQLTNTFDF
jgi:hypothetical protein